MEAASNSSRVGEEADNSPVAVAPVAGTNQDPLRSQASNQISATSTEVVGQNFRFVIIKLDQNFLFSPKSFYIYKTISKYSKINIYREEVRNLTRKMCEMTCKL